MELVNRNCYDRTKKREANTRMKDTRKAKYTICWQIELQQKQIKKKKKEKPNVNACILGNPVNVHSQHSDF